MAEDRLEGDGGGRGRPAAARVRGRDGWEPTPPSTRCTPALRKGTQGTLCSVPRNRGKNTTLLANMSVDGMGPSLAVTGAVDAAVFEAYLEQVLLPHLRPGRIVVMDNLSAHKSERVKEMIEGAGCELVYLPSYSPDFNPIEEAFAKIKGILRKAEARTREALVEALVEAMGRALSSVGARDARSFFKHCGYCAAVQPF